MKKPQKHIWIVKDTFQKRKNTRKEEKKSTELLCDVYNAMKVGQLSQIKKLLKGTQHVLPMNVGQANKN